MKRPSPLTRRACLLGAASAAVPPVSAAPAGSRLDELIADWRMVTEECSALCAAADRIFATAALPKVEAWEGRQRFRYPFEVERRFDALIEAWANDRLQAEFAPRLRERRDELMADLARQEAILIEAERACGVTTAEALADQAGHRAHGLRGEIIAYRPSCMAEVATKNAFLLELARGGEALSGEDLELVFAVSARG